MNEKKLAGLGFLVFVMAISSGAMQSGRVDFTVEEKEFLSKKGTLKICIDPQWMPLERLTPDGKHEGISADFLAIILGRSGIPYEVVPSKSWVASLEMARRRDCDILSMASETPGRKEFMNSTTPFLKLQTVIATLMHQPFIDDISELSGKKIGVIRGYSHVELLKLQNPDIILVEIDAYHDGLMQVQNGTLHGVVGNIA